MHQSRLLSLPIVLALSVAGCAHHHHHHDDDDQGYSVVRFDDLPPHVRDNFHHDHPGGDVHEVRVVHEGGEDHYHFVFNEHGAPHETEYRHEGDEIRSAYK